MSERLGGGSKGLGPCGRLTAVLKGSAASLVALCLAWGASFAQTRSAPAARSQSAAVARSQGAPAAQAPKDPARWSAALKRVSAVSLRKHLTYIASDELEGRATPSRGLDLAATYIAEQFRRAGLEPAGDDGYFQTANWKLTGRDPAAFRLSFGGVGAAAPAVTAEQIGVGFSIAGLSLWEPSGELSLSGARLFKVDFAGAPANLTSQQVGGRVVLTEFPAIPRGDQARALQALRERDEFMARMRGLGSPLVISFDRASASARRRAPRAVDPNRPTTGRNTPELGLGGAQAAPLVVVHGAAAASFYDALPAGDIPTTLDVRIPAALEAPVKLRNVAGILRGSDPALKDTYVIVSAHYDHVGVREGCDRAKEDCIFNGANDDGSGTVGVIELASALSKVSPRPRRSILFLTFFGEEMGLVGSRFYGRSPVAPLAKTIAQVNMEQIGRTDDSEGPQVGSFALTGFDYSEVGAVLQSAGEAEGVRVYKHPTNSDSYFSRSDNQSLADAGVPAHTAGVAFSFPDYHAVGDEVSKIDFANMERVVRAVGRGLLRLANSPQEPRWDEQNPRAARYAEAWRKLHGK